MDYSKKLISILVFSSVLVFSAFAQNQSSEFQTSEVESETFNSKETPVGLWLETESITERPDKSIKSVDTHFKPTVAWTFSDESQVKFFPYFYTTRDTEKGNSHSYVGHMDSYSLWYTKTDILTEEEHGIDFGTSQRVYFRPTQNMKRRFNNAGFMNSRFYLTKRLSDNFLLDNEAKFYWSFVSDKYSSVDTAESYNHIILVKPTFELSAQFKLFVEFEQQSTVNYIAPSDDFVSVNPGFKYIPSDDFYWQFQIERKVLQSRDQLSSNRYTGIRTEAEYKFNDRISTWVEVVGNLTSPQNGGLGTRNFADTASVEVDFKFVVL